MMNEQLEAARQQQSVHAQLVEIAVATQPIFAANGWEYRRGEEAHVPSVGEIASLLLRLWADTDPTGDHTIASGRFEVWKPEDAEAVVSLKFDIEGTDPSDD